MLNPNVGFLSIDFPGHGYSSRIPQGAYYHYTCYLLTIKSIMNFLKWPKISLMGHSLGGIISYVYTMVYTKEVDFVICLDGAKPMIPNDKLLLLSKQLTKFLKYDQHAVSPIEPPSYKLEDIVKKVCQPNKNSILPQFAHYVLERNIAPSQLHKGEELENFFCSM